MKKLDPAVTYMRENPKASVKEVCEKFMLSKQTVYNLRNHHGLSKKIKKPVEKKARFHPDDRKDKLIHQMLEEICSQQAIINYLENKLARHGVAV
jgi:predicted DNA-binding protein YlxM (UPF0122 family)